MPPGFETAEVDAETPEVDELEIRHLGSRDYVLLSTKVPSRKRAFESHRSHP